MSKILNQMVLRLVKLVAIAFHFKLRPNELRQILGHRCQIGIVDIENDKRCVKQSDRSGKS
ncbi:hypothetical protein H6F74_00815 [Trichocoleus sp. FACHB-90]|uniref:hypothetical protein n=2 Tax=Cyanophyceae TaxID=3028117 RepID=UPI0019BD86C3|nr:hypothetical protein [Trichocoleus sp. FACHB-90]MBD1924830.1 hypothetical protein [Trichocoleus sp. FACHB-90]